VKRRELERWLRSHGARLLRHGASHDVWVHDGLKGSVPRHGEIRRGTVIAICKQLNLPEPR
jgi:predicted RNA binding protein YcfA (HicA-like mRNA interferase family)